MDIKQRELIIGNIKGKEITYSCIECNEEELKYFTTLNDKETHYTRCYKCILNDIESIEHFKMKTEWALGKRG